MLGGRVAVANRGRSGKAQGRQRKESRWGKEHLDPWHNAETAAITPMTANLDCSGKKWPVR